MQRFKAQMIVFAVAAIALMLVARPGLAQDKTDSDSEAVMESGSACIAEAERVYSQCTGDHAWYVGVLCMSQYLADVEGCGSIGLSKIVGVVAGRKE